MKTEGEHTGKITPFKRQYIEPTDLTQVRNLKVNRRSENG